MYLDKDRWFECDTLSLYMARQRPEQSANRIRAEYFNVVYVLSVIILPYTQYHYFVLARRQVQQNR